MVVWSEHIEPALPAGASPLILSPEGCLGWAVRSLWVATLAISSRVGGDALCATFSSTIFFLQLVF